MGKGKLRISKPPEERRQEIMDTAMLVFSEKGYEQTTMRDIASAAGIVPGLCYRYFPSKQALFEASIAQYAADYCAPIVRALKEHRGDSGGLFACVMELFIQREGKEKYSAFFHKAENRSFHILLSHAVCDYVYPFAKDFFDSLNENGTAHIQDTASFARFVLYGQIPIINDETLCAEKKAEIIHHYLKKLMGS